MFQLLLAIAISVAAVTWFTTASGPEQITALAGAENIATLLVGFFLFAVAMQSIMNTTGKDRKKKNAIIIGVVVALQVVTFVGMPHLFNWAKNNLPARAEQAKADILSAQTQAK